MKRTLLTCVGVLALVSSALAADLPPPSAYKAPPLPAPSWTGCYINGGGGGALMSTNQSNVLLATGAPLTPATDNGGQGWFGVAGGGCDYQMHVWNWDVVAGAFGDYDFMNIRGTPQFVTLGGAATGDVKETSAWAAGLRLGVLVSPSVLVYTTGGYTGTHFNSVNLSLVATGAAAATLPSQNLNGWFIGGGTETSLSFVMPGLFLRTEYRYASYQTTTNTFLTPAGAATGFGLRSNTYTQSIFTELVWRFNFGGMHW